MKVSCGECRYWIVRGKTIKGECKRNAALLDPRGYGAWPLTSTEDFCFDGEMKLESLNEG
jgi:hypothetical protein